MKKVFVPVKLNEAQKARIEAVSDQFQFVYQPQEDADIIIGNYPADQLKKFTKLQWIQLTAVGYDAYIKKGVFDHEVTICNAVDIHSEEVAEHLLGLLMSTIKNLHLYRDHQAKHEWIDEGRIKSIQGYRVCILGLGDIGKTLARILKSMGMFVRGVKRTPIEKPDYVDELMLQDQIDEAISDVDAVISVIPGTAENRYLMTLERFKKMRPDTILINGGRGNLVERSVLEKVLKEKIIAAIASDVHEIEPLPADDPLWDYPNFIATPHVAGYFHLASALDRYVELVCENLRRDAEQQPLKYIVTERE